MPVKNIRLPGNSVYYGKITGIDEDEKKILEDAGIGGGGGITDHDKEVYDATSASVLSVGDFKDTWIEGHTYVADDIVLWNGHFYLVTADIDSSETEPDKDADHFAIFDLDRLDCQDISVGTGLEIKGGKLNCTITPGVSESELNSVKNTLQTNINNVQSSVPTDLMVNGTHLGLGRNGTWMTNSRYLVLGDGLKYDSSTRTLSAEGGSGGEDARIGDLSTLKTNAKDTVVNAINEVEEETDNLAKVTPTDIKINDSNELVLFHDGTEITGQKEKIEIEDSDLDAMEFNAEVPTETTPTLLNTIKVGDTYYKIIEPVAVSVDAKAEATNGTITDAQLAVLQASDSNYIMFNHEKFFLNDDGAKEGFLTYTHVGHENSKTTLKFFTITVSTKAWVLTTQSVQTINVTENDDNTVSLEIS